MCAHDELSLSLFMSANIYNYVKLLDINVLVTGFNRYHLSSSNLSLVSV